MLIFVRKNETEELLKAHVKGYTKKDGTYVQEHDDKRKVASYDHPNVVGHAEKLEGGGPNKAHGMSFAGKRFSASGKEGTSMHDNTPVRHFREVTDDGEDTGQHVWMDHGGRVHADGRSEVPKLRAEYENHAAKADQANKPARVTHASLKKHPMYSESDHQYFKDKGYTPAEIKDIWDRDHKAGHEPVEHGPVPDVVGLVSDPDYHKKASVKTKNEGHGYHGEAHDEFLRNKHGADDYTAKSTEADIVEARKHADKKFDNAIKNLVSGGYFDNHEDARDFLDSKSGRHLHDSAVSKGGDISKVTWLGKEVSRYKKATGK